MRSYWRYGPAKAKRDARASDVAGAVAESFLRGRRSLPSCGDRLAPLLALRGTDAAKPTVSFTAGVLAAQLVHLLQEAVAQSLLRVTTGLARFALARIPNVAPR